METELYSTVRAQQSTINMLDHSLKKLFNTIEPNRKLIDCSKTLKILKRTNWNTARLTFADNLINLTTRKHTSSELRVRRNRLALYPKKTISKLGMTKDVSYIHDINKVTDKTIENLKRINLDPNKDFVDIFGSEVNIKAYSLLKKDIFKSIPPELNKEVQHKFFAKILNSHKLETLLLEGREDNKLGIPSSRNDAVILLKWLNSVTKEILSNQDQQLELLQTVYYLSFREVIRQISVYCTEKGFLVWELWSAYVSLIESLSECYNKNMKEAKESFDKQIKEIKNKSTSEQEKFMEKCKRLEEELVLEKKMNNELTIRGNLYKAEAKELETKLKQEKKNVLKILQRFHNMESLYKKEVAKTNELEEELIAGKGNCIVYKKLLKKYCTIEKFNELTLILPELSDPILEESFGVCEFDIIRYYTDKEIQVMLTEEVINNKDSKLSFETLDEITWRAKGSKTKKYKVKPKKAVNDNAKVQKESKLCINSSKDLTEELVRKESKLNIFDKEVQCEKIVIPETKIINNTQEQFNLECNTHTNSTQYNTINEPQRTKE